MNKENRQPEREEDEYGLPPRSTIFPSERNKVSMIFYRTLFALFLILTATLMAWGLTLHPPAE